MKYEIITDDVDNKTILDYLYSINSTLPVHERIAIDCDITKIIFDDDKIIFNFIVINPIFDFDGGITEDIVPDRSEDLGKIGEVSINGFDEPIKSVLLGAIREIKLRKILN